MNIRIESIKEIHVEGFFKALDCVAREREYLIFVEAPPFEDVKSFVLSNVGRNNQFVALDGKNEVVGWCDVLSNSSPGFTHSGTLGMGVLPDYRGKGIGKDLILTTLNAAFEKNLERVQLDVFANNQTAIRLYEKVGFQHEGVRRRARFIDGQWSDLIMMGLLRSEFRED